VLEVDGDRDDLSGSGFEVTEPPPLVALGCRVVDLKDARVRELRHAPGPGVEAGAEHHDLPGAVARRASSMATVRGTISTAVRRTSS